MTTASVHPFTPEQAYEKMRWGLQGIVPRVTGAVGTCPLYTLLAVSTCSRAAAAGVAVPTGHSMRA